MDAYASYVASKYRPHRSAASVDVTPQEIRERYGLFEFQARLVAQALRRGRSCLFASTGLGKTAMQLVWADLTGRRTLILAPLAVSAQTVREAEKFGILGVLAAKSQEGASGARIVVTNYERLENFNPLAFEAVVLDESSILKSYDGKTRTAILEAFRATPFKLACSATPAPNDHTELANHAEFVGACTRNEMLATYFVHDGGATQSWRLKGHAKRDFWRWCCSWASFVRHPRDVGDDTQGYDLPALVEHETRVHADEGSLAPDQLFLSSLDLSQKRRAKRMSLGQRCAAAAEIVRAEPDRQWLVWCDLNDEGDALADALADLGAVQVAGSDTAEHKERTLVGFAEGTVPILVSKSSICGFGMNFQRCSRMVFVGVNDSWEQRYQAIRRCWRFGQESEVHVHYVLTEAETFAQANVASKDAKNEDMYAMAAEETANALDDAGREERSASEGASCSGDGWDLRLGDCVRGIAALPDESVDYSVFSPPFASLYTYTDDPFDMGNCRDYREFAGQFRFLAAELLRVLRPGRLVSFHCMNLPTSKSFDGWIGIRDFRGLLIRIFERAGWIYHSEVCIWKDPVTAMQRTKALGLLHKQIRKDSAMSRQGIPDYVVTMRKPGVNPRPIGHTSDEFPVELWQRWASPVWDDINPSDTLQKESAREHEDERHIAPLQLEVIRRCIGLWTAAGDLVLSPFAGIGSEGYQAVRMGRRFVGFELKRSYYEQATRNLAAAELEAKQGTLFDLRCG